MDWKDYAQKQDCAFRAPEAERFFLELSDTDAHSHASAESLEKNGVGPWRPGYNFGAFAAEWGYGYTHLRGQKDGMGREIGGAEDPPPADRPQALEAAEKFLRQFYIREMPRPWVSMNGHYPWHHSVSYTHLDVYKRQRQKPAKSVQKGIRHYAERPILHPRYLLGGSEPYEGGEQFPRSCRSAQLEFLPAAYHGEFAAAAG